MSSVCLDSSAWIEIFHAGDNASRFIKALGSPDTAIVPSICLYEVWKYTVLHADADRARIIVRSMSQGQLVAIDSEIALAAAELSLKHKLPMADAMIYASARSHGAILWTQDKHFEGLSGVRYLQKQPS